MKNKLFKRVSIKDKAAKQELLRAHLIIVLLCLALMMVLELSAGMLVQLDITLSTIAVVLLALVTIASGSIVIAIKKSK
jgi:hypothetical protein